MVDKRDVYLTPTLAPACSQINDCGKNFQWITMHETVDADAFSQPLALGKLALFLSGALRKVSTWTHAAQESRLASPPDLMRPRPLFLL